METETAVEEDVEEPLEPVNVICGPFVWTTFSLKITSRHIVTRKVEESGARSLAVMPSHW